MASEMKLSDYKVLDFFVRNITLELNLTKTPIQSKAQLTIEPNIEVSSEASTLQLDCENIQLQSVLLDGEALSTDEYQVTANALIIKKVPQGRAFTIATTSLLGENTDLFGLYKTEGTILVKAETEGLRRVFPCIDRPDNLADYTTIIIANKKEYPTLLANGTLLNHTNYDDGSHSVTWYDPIPKPSYLFAMVAGDLPCTSTSYTTQSDREIPINFYIPEQDVEKCAFAKEVLKAAMQWDEDRFKLENILPEFKVAGVNKYASGASEPLGLNLFNTTNLYATEQSRKDTDIIRVLDVVSHEYFHTWTGNLVTIRDWFNLAAKEGLTTFRASQFIEQCLGIDPERIFANRGFDERAPRPESYTAVRSLYTSAAYEKSAEVFRMIMNTMSKEKFDEGLASFLKANAGNAITLEDILNSLSTFSGTDVKPFIAWFSESGTPEVTVTDEYNAITKIYKLKFLISESKGRPIPVTLKLYNSHGSPISPEETVILDQSTIIVEYHDIAERPIPSLLRGLSAPVTLDYHYTNEQLLLLMRYDDDIYNQNKAAKKLITHLVSDYCSGQSISFDSDFGSECIAVYMSLLLHSQQQPWVVAELVDLPSEEILITSLPGADYEKITEARHLIQQKLGTALKLALQHALKMASVPPSTSDLLFDFHAAGNRRLKAVCTAYLLAVTPKTTEEALINQFNSSLGKNMTDTISALTLLASSNCSQLGQLLERFYNYWHHDIDAINYWFNLQAASHSSDVVAQVAHLMQHPAFDLSNPNKVYALLGMFMKNPFGFHQISGAGYNLVASAILKLELINPSLAANLTQKFYSWELLDKQRQKLILDTLTYLCENAVTDDVRNMAKKDLEKADFSMPSHPKLQNPTLKGKIRWDFFVEKESLMDPNTDFIDSDSDDEGFRFY